MRGLLGRGLVARRGVAVGVGVTACLFASAHLHPVQAAGLLPFAVLVQLAYLSGKSLWLPVALHFANNAFFVSLMKAAAAFGPEGALDPPDPDALPPLSVPLLVAATGTVAAACWLLWGVRVRAFARGWREVPPRYELPTPPPAPLHPGRRWDWRPAAAFAAGWAALIATASYEIARAAAGAG